MTIDEFLTKYPEYAGEDEVDYKAAYEKTLMGQVEELNRVVAQVVEGFKPFFDAVNKAIEALVEFFRKMWRYLPRSTRRRIAKNVALQKHRDRVAARKQLRE